MLLLWHLRWRIETWKFVWFGHPNFHTLPHVIFFCIASSYVFVLMSFAQFVFLQLFAPSSQANLAFWCIFCNHESSSYVTSLWMLSVNIFFLFKWFTYENLEPTKPPPRSWVLTWIWCTVILSEYTTRGCIWNKCGWQLWWAFLLPAF